MQASVINLTKVTLPLILFSHLPDSSLVNVYCIGAVALMIQYRHRWGSNVHIKCNVNF